jgi:hypothetical protein
LALVAQEGKQKTDQTAQILYLIPLQETVAVVVVLVKQMQPMALLVALAVAAVLIRPR